MHTKSNGDKRHVLSSGEFNEVHPSHISAKDCKYGATQTHKPHKLIWIGHNGSLQKRTHDQDTVFVRWKEIDTI